MLKSGVNSRLLAKISGERYVFYPFVPFCQFFNSFQSSVPGSVINKNHFCPICLQLFCYFLKFFIEKRQDFLLIIAGNDQSQFFHIYFLSGFFVYELTRLHFPVPFEIF